MADRMREDVRANPKGIREFAADSAQTIAVGDFCWHDTDDAKPASATALWTGTEAGTLGKFAEKFVGVAKSAHNTSSVNLGIAADTKVRVMTKGVFAYPCTSATFEIGDLVSGKKDTGNTLLAQEVQKTTNPSMAIGKVTKRYASATTVVEFEIMGATNPGGGIRAFVSS